MSRAVPTRIAPSGPAPHRPVAPAAPPDPFRRLGLYGLARLTPVLLAALATEEPLLLIGPHGTAKSLLLTRIASALGLSFRHYNASLLNFDDLVGFPLPGKDGHLEYVKTPAAIWGAGAVIFDEISRCRPDIQNKLFPIVHERKVQGLPLVGLTYRWAAMNPPPTDDHENGYVGSEALDAALADRFAFVVEMPSWERLTEEEQLAVIRAGDIPVDPDAARTLSETLVRIRAAMPAVRGRLSESVAGYVRAVVALLAQGNLPLSPRRAGMLFRSILAVQAAALTVEPGRSPSDNSLLALHCSLPQRAEGIPVSDTTLLAAHREAWKLAAIRPDDPLRAILLTADPVDRLRLAVQAQGLPKGEFSGIIADALARLPAGAREAAIVHLFESDGVGRLNAAVAEQAAQLYSSIAVFPEFSETLHASSPRFRTWGRIKDLLSRLDPTVAGDQQRANALAAAFARQELATPEDAEAAFEAYRVTDLRLRAA
jgi:MoxR-like ATPase